jgi:hypothetical protein
MQSLPQQLFFDDITLLTSDADFNRIPDFKILNLFSSAELTHLYRRSRWFCWFAGRARPLWDFPKQEIRYEDDYILVWCVWA